MDMSPRDPFATGPLVLRRSARRAAQDDRIDLADLWGALWRGRLMVLGCAVAGMLFAALAVSQVTPQYTSLAKVLLDPRESRFITETEVVSDLVLSDQVIDSELSILRSNVLLGDVIRSIGPDRLAAIDPAAQEPGLLASLLGADAPVPPTEAEMEATVERLVWVLRRTMSVWREGESYIIGIEATTPDPDLSQILAQTLADRYIAQQLAGRQATAQQATEWIEQRAADLRGQVEAAETAVQAYRATEVAEDGPSVEIATQQLLELNNQLVLARVDRVAAESRVSEIARLLDADGPAAVAELVSTDALDGLKDERLALLRRDAVWAERYDESHPERTRIRGELVRLDQDMEAELRKHLDSLRKEVEIARLREQTLADSVKEMEARVVSASQAAIGLRQLQREADAARASYEELLTRLSQTRTQEKFQTADARLIERATRPGAPSAPRPKLMMAMGGMGGFLLGLVALLLRVLARPTVHTVQDLELESGLPVVASVPEGDWTTRRAAMTALSRDPFGLVAERVRRIRAAIELADEDAASQSVVLLSAMPEEGKTTLSLFLAQVAQLSGKAVIVVDCDLRRPSLQAEFGWDMRHDLADLIRGRCGLDQAIYDDTGLGFDVLAARGSNPGAADQMSRRWLRGVLEELKLYYDLVIVNAPALLDVSDALTIAQATDHRFVVVRHGHTPRRAVARALGALGDAGIAVDGMVLSRADPRDEAAAYSRTYTAAAKEMRHA
jgi:uncharacterized protein involved in exopolysaccharide biosynthesis/Mrp family chromosome partitioning ATPase